MKKEGEKIYIRKCTTLSSIVTKWTMYIYCDLFNKPQYQIVKVICHVYFFLSLKSSSPD